jgi:hypothetical protein
MPKHKISLGSDPAKNFSIIRNWCNTLEDKLEVKSNDEQKIMYIAINTSTTPKTLAVYEKRGDVDVLVGTINITAPA